MLGGVPCSGDSKQNYLDRPLGMFNQSDREMQ